MYVKRVVAGVGTALVLASVSLVAGSTGASAAVSPDAICPNNNHPNNDGYTGTNVIGTNGAKIRTGSNTACNAVGEAFVGNKVTLHCYRWNGSHYWDYLVDHTQGKSGWVREDLLNVVSDAPCS